MTATLPTYVTVYKHFDQLTPLEKLTVDIKGITHDETKKDNDAVYQDPKTNAYRVNVTIANASVQELDLAAQTLAARSVQQDFEKNLDLMANDMRHAAIEQGSTAITSGVLADALGIPSSLTLIQKITEFQNNYLGIILSSAAVCYAFALHRKAHHAWNKYDTMPNTEKTIAQSLEGNAQIKKDIHTRLQAEIANRRQMIIHKPS